MTRRIAYYGGTRRERNRVVFDRVVQRQANFLYLTRNRHRRRQLERLYLEKHPACFDIPILTFAGLIGRLTQDPDTRPAISEASRLLLLEEIIHSWKTTRAANAEHSGGLLGRISRGIARLKEQNILEPELLVPSSRQRSQDPFSHELVWCFSRYQDRLADLGMEDWWGRQALAYRGLLTGAIRLPESLAASRSLVVEGFSDMTPVEHSILRHLREAVDELVVSTDLEPGPVDEEESETFHEMRSLLSDPGLEWRSVPGPRPEPRPRVICLPSAEDEAAWVAEKIAGLEPSTFVAVVSSRSELYRLELTSALARRGIELAEARGASAQASTNLGLLQDYLKLIQEQFPRQYLFDFLNHPRVAAGLTSEDLNGIENWAIACNVREGFRNWSIDFPARVFKALENLPDDSPFSTSGIRPALAAFSKLMGSLNVAVERHSPSQWLDLLEGRLAPFLSPLPADDLLGVRSENLMLQGLLREIQRLDDQYPEPLELYQFARCLKLVSESMVLELELGAPRCVFARPKEIEQLEVDALIWVGLTDREFLPRVTDTRFSGRDSVLQPSTGWEEQVREQDSLFGWMRGQASSSVTYTFPERAFGVPALVSPLLRDQPVEKRAPSEPLPALDAAVEENVQRGRRGLLSRESSSASAFERLSHLPRVTPSTCACKLGEGKQDRGVTESARRLHALWVPIHGRARCLDLEKESWTPELDRPRTGGSSPSGAASFHEGSGAVWPPRGRQLGSPGRWASGGACSKQSWRSWPLRDTRQRESDLDSARGVPPGRS